MADKPVPAAAQEFLGIVNRLVPGGSAMAYRVHGSTVQEVEAEQQRTVLRLRLAGKHADLPITVRCRIGSVVTACDGVLGYTGTLEFWAVTQRSYNRDY